MASLRMTSAPPCVTAAFVLRVTGFWRPLCYVLRASGARAVLCVTGCIGGLGMCYSTQDRVTVLLKTAQSSPKRSKVFRLRRFIGLASSWLQRWRLAEPSQLHALH